MKPINLRHHMRRQRHVSSRARTTAVIIPIHSDQPPRPLACVLSKLSRIARESRYMVPDRPPLGDAPRRPHLFEVGLVESHGDAPVDAVVEALADAASLDLDFARDVGDILLGGGVGRVSSKGDTPWKVTACERRTASGSSSKMCPS